MKKIFLAVLFALAFASGVWAEQPIKSASSGNVANASTVATLSGGVGQFTYITGFEATFSGATAGLCVNATVTGVLGGTMTYPVCAPVGALVQGVPLVVQFSRPLQSSAVNTNIVVTLPALGLGNTNAAVVVHGYVE